MRSRALIPVDGAIMGVARAGVQRRGQSAAPFQLARRQGLQLGDGVTSQRTPAAVPAACRRPSPAAISCRLRANGPPRCACRRPARPCPAHRSCKRSWRASPSTAATSQRGGHPQRIPDRRPAAAPLFGFHQRTRRTSFVCQWPVYRRPDRDICQSLGDVFDSDLQNGAER